jgi:uncharacterized membrane-anchored protein
MRIAAALALTLTVLGNSTALAQDEGSREADASLFQSIAWNAGPTKAELGDESHLSVPEGCRFTGADGARTFLELTENPPSGSEKGVLLCQAGATGENMWFVVFSFDPSGYVKDDDGKSLDADAILTSIKRGTEQGNRERRKRGWETINIDGWVRSPYYDQQTHNLTWSLKALSPSGDATVNHSVRLLGRGGVMHADLVAEASTLDQAVAAFDGIIATHAFVPGRTYAEWREGDKIASYGLTALVAGGVGAAVVKSGLLAKLGRLIIAIIIAMKKLIVVAVVGIGAWLKSLFRKKEEATPASAGGASAG